MRSVLNKVYPWLVWAIASAFVFYKYILEVSTGVLGPQMMLTINMDATALGSMIAYYFYAYLIMQLPMGMLLDRYGPKIVMTCCLFLCALGTYALGSTQVYFWACAARFLTGLGAAAAVIGSMKLISMWFPINRFATMVGLTMTLGMMGAVYGEAPLYALSATMGWQPALHKIAGVGAIILFLFIFILRDKPIKSQQLERSSSVLSSLKCILIKPQSWLLSIFSGLLFAPISALGGAWGGSFLVVTQHLSLPHATTAVSMIFLGFALGAPTWGYISDKLYKRLPFLYAAVIVSLLCMTLIMCLSLSYDAIMALLFLFGFFISALVLSFSMIREVNYLVFAATAVAFMNVFNSVLSALADYSIGKLLDLFWGGLIQSGHKVYSAHAYHMAMLLIPVGLLVAFIVLLSVKETHAVQYK